MARQWNAASLDCVTMVSVTSTFGWARSQAVTLSPRLSRSGAIVAEKTFTALKGFFSPSILTMPLPLVPISSCLEPLGGRRGDVAPRLVPMVLDDLLHFVLAEDVVARLGDREDALHEGGIGVD